MCDDYVHPFPQMSPRKKEPSPHAALHEGQWFSQAGDVDDFIFYWDDEETHSSR